MSFVEANKRRVVHGFLGLLLATGALVLSTRAADAALVKKITSRTATPRWSAPYNLYVVGTAYRGNTFWAQGPAVKGWRWGYLGGHVNYCVWIWGRSVSKGGTSTANRCGAPRDEPPGSVLGFSNGQIGSNRNNNDGKKTRLTPRAPGCGGSIQAWGNVKPWQDVASPRKVVLRTSRARTVMWRYVTRDGQYVLVRDPELGTTGGYPPNWYFVKRQCVKLS